jgi:MFS family permease
LQTDEDLQQESAARRVTLRVVPLLCIAFFLSFIDRTNIGILADDIGADLHLGAEAFGFAVGIFYLGYLLLQVPSNVAMHRFGGRIWITRILATWGIACAATAFVQTDVQLYIARFVLGAAEAGLVPAIYVLLTQWYTRAHRARPFGLFSVTEPVALTIGAVATSSLLGAFAGVGWIAGWRWVFLIEGLVTVVYAVVFWFMLPPDASRASWLTDAERRTIARELALEEQEVDPDNERITTGRKVLLALTSWRGWYLSATYFTIIIGFWTVTYYMPSILGERFDTGSVTAGFISAVPWLFAIVTILLASWMTKNSENFRWHFVFWLLAAAGGFYLAAATDSAWLALIGFSLSCGGIEAVFPLFFRSIGSMFVGITAAVIFALANSVGNVGGFVGPYLYGVLTEVTGSGTAGLYVMGVMLVIAAALGGFIDRIDPRRAQQSQSVAV